MTPSRITDKEIAHDMAIEYDKHWEVAQHAKQLGLQSVAAHVLLSGVLAADELGTGTVTSSAEASSLSQPQSRELGGALRLRARTFEEARARKRILSDQTIGQILDDALVVGGQKSYGGVKGYVDNIRLDRSDVDLLRNPEEVIALYRKQIDLVHDFLRVGIATSGEDRYEQMKQKILNKVNEKCAATTELMRAWMNGGTVAQGIGTGLRWGLPDQNKLSRFGDARPNLSVQDQVVAVGMMAYSGPRVVEKVYQTGEPMTKRIYLNPRLVDAPLVFGELLHKFDEAGVSAQIKMWNRVGDLLKRIKDRDATGGICGDGIVVYTNDTQANRVLDIVLGVAEHHVESFVGRELCRIPQPIADGIGVGDEPSNSRSSLTAHRAALLEEVAAETRKSGLDGSSRIDYFRRLLAQRATEWGVNPQNLAFNL